MRRRAILIVYAIALAACNRAPAPVEALPENAPAAESPAPAPASMAMPAAAPEPSAMAGPQRPAPMPAGSRATYRCDDGTRVDVHFNGIAATVAWPDGRTAQLSQPASTSGDQPQVYSDRNVRIERAADGLHLRDHDRAEALCAETEASA
jgi:hypothetical protein